MSQQQPAEPTPRVWCAYVRVSKVKGREGEKFHSPDEQEERIRRSTSDVVAKVFTDLDVSGGTWARAGLDAAVAWMQQAPNRRGLMVMDIDRLGRDLEGSLKFVKEMKDLGHAVRVLHEEIDTTSADGMVRWQVLMLFAEFQRKKASERWLSIQQRRRDAGRPASGIPRFGYRRLLEGEKDKRQATDGTEIVLEEGDFVPDETTGPLLAQCYRKYTAGAGYQKLVKFLNDQGVKTGRNTDWSTHSLRRTLDSGFGAGLLVLTKGGMIPGRHEPVITVDEWEQFQSARGKRKEKPSKTSTPKWYLSGIARCGYCGGGLVVSSHANPDASVLCGGYRNTRVCRGVWIPRYMVEMAVTLWVGGHITELATQAWDTSARDAVRADVESRLAGARKAQESAQTALSRLATGYATGLLEEEGVRDARPALDAAKEAADAMFADVYAEFQTLAPVDMDEYARLANAGAGLTPSEWGALLGRVLGAVKVTEAELIFVPVVGEPQITQRPPRRKRPPQEQDPRSGRFVTSGT